MPLVWQSPKYTKSGGIDNRVSATGHAVVGVVCVAVDLSMSKRQQRDRDANEVIALVLVHESRMYICSILPHLQIVDRLLSLMAFATCCTPFNGAFFATIDTASLTMVVVPHRCL